MHLYLKVQKKIHVSGRTGIPLGVLDGNNGSGTKLTAHALARHNISNEENDCDHDGTESMVSALSLLSVRPSNETPEERCQRKGALRQYRKVCDVILNLSYVYYQNRGKNSHLDISKLISIFLCPLFLLLSLLHL